MDKTEQEFVEVLEILGYEIASQKKDGKQDFKLVGSLDEISETMKATCLLLENLHRFALSMMASTAGEDKNDLTGLINIHRNLMNSFSDNYEFVMEKIIEKQDVATVETTSGKSS